jgi:hypothetical protein
MKNEYFGALKIHNDWLVLENDVISFCNLMIERPKTISMDRVDAEVKILFMIHHVTSTMLIRRRFSSVT